MYENAIKILKKLNACGFQAYIIGGYPRNTYLGIVSNDIDICTSATPADIASLFPNVDISSASYGAVHFMYGGFSYDLTTFRKDKSMLNGNRFYAVEYIDDLKEDLYRRDFIMNTLCIDKDGNYVDYLDATSDIDNRVIQTIKNPSISFKEDPLRMLRAIRFSTTLSFSLSSEICTSLVSMKHLLYHLSINRIKHELDLIFSSQNCMLGITYLKDFGMDEVLSLDLDDISYSSNYLGIWAQCSLKEKYPFTKTEKRIIDNIQKILNLTPSFFVLYEYGIDICKIVDDIHGNDIYYQLDKEIPIHNRSEINIDKQFLLLNVPHCLISTMYQKIEYEILCGNLCNEEEQIQHYILNNI